MGKTKYYEATYNVKMMIGTADIKFEMWYKDVLRSDMLTLRWEELGDPA